MTTWDQATVYNAQRLRTSVAVSEETLVVARDPEALLQSVGSKLADALQEAARTLAIDLDERDIHLLRGSRNPRTYTTNYHAYWNPQTKDIELVGGPEDGKCLAYRDAPRLPLRVPVYNGDAYRVDPYPMPLTGLAMYAEYEPAGWNPTTRHWIYKAAK